MFGSTSSSSSHDAETLASSLELDHANIEAQLQRDATSKSLKLPTKDEFFLVLVRLRLGLLEMDLAYRFEVSQSYVSAVLNTWIPFLRAQLQNLLRWSQTTVGPKNGVFEHFPNAIAAIDCTEIQIERPHKIPAQRAVYSQYKKSYHNEVPCCNRARLRSFRCYVTWLPR